MKKILALISIISLTGCIAVPRIEMAETLDFDYQIQNVQPLSYTDLLCCYECNA
jgi:hypothetical protein